MINVKHHTCRYDTTLKQTSLDIRVTPIPHIFRLT